MLHWPCVDLRATGQAALLAAYVLRFFGAITRVERGHLSLVSPKHPVAQANAEVAKARIRSPEVIEARRIGGL